MSSETPRKTPFVLIISVALNGLLIGLLAGVLLSGGPHKRGGPPGPGPGPDGGPASIDRGLARAILQSAPRSERTEIRRAMGDAWRSTADQRQTIRNAQRTIAEAIRSETFDEDTVSQAFEDWRNADLEIKTKVQTALVEALSTLPPEGRAALAEEMTKHQLRREKRGEKFRERLRDRLQERRNGED